MALVTDILKQGFRISVELVPSMIDREGHPSLEETLTTLDAHVKPSFISVTQGAGGTSREQSPFLLSRLQGRELCAHLICGFAPRAEVLRHAANFYAMGVRNFLVLKGDTPAAPEGMTPSSTAIGTEGDYLYAADCIKELRAKYNDLCIGVAAYPDAATHDERITYLRAKRESGADFAITQMLFSADTYRAFVKELALENFPILPGTCFLHSTKHADQFAKRFGVKIPSPEKPIKDLITEFKNAGAPGLHLFVLNDVPLVKSQL